MRILLAAPEPHLAARLLTVLVEAGCTVTAMSEGVGALAVARGGDFDVLLLDDLLPGLSGSTVVRALREEGDVTPVLLVGAEPAAPCALDEVPWRLGTLRARSGATAFATLTARADDAGLRVPLPRPWHAAEVLALLQQAS